LGAARARPSGKDLALRMQGVAAEKNNVHYAYKKQKKTRKGEIFEF
jgi:hypothetical protein